MRLQKHRCQRRLETNMGRLSYGGEQPLPDTWEANRWGWGPWRRWKYWIHAGPKALWFNTWVQKVHRRAHSHWYRKLVFLPRCWMIGNTKWFWPWQPRTCSYCGGVHPEDGIRLLEQGWECDRSSKGYKAYLNPAGARAHRIRMMSRLAKQTNRTQVLNWSEAVWSPIPPVKFYVQHCTERQLACFNFLVRGAQGEA